MPDAWLMKWHCPHHAVEWAGPGSWQVQEGDKTVVCWITGCSTSPVSGDYRCESGAKVLWASPMTAHWDMTPGKEAA